MPKNLTFLWCCFTSSSNPHLNSLAHRKSRPHHHWAPGNKDQHIHTDKLQEQKNRQLCKVHRCVSRVEMGKTHPLRTFLSSCNCHPHCSLVLPKAWPVSDAVEFRWGVGSWQYCPCLFPPTVLPTPGATWARCRAGSVLRFWTSYNHRFNRCKLNFIGGNLKNKIQSAQPSLPQATLLKRGLLLTYSSGILCALVRITSL
jgi:hypothetical protein